MFLVHLEGGQEGHGCYARKEEKIVELCKIIKVIAHGFILGEGIMLDMMISIE